MASGNANIKIFIDGKGAGDTVRDLQNQYYKLNREIKELTPGTQAYNDKAKELANLKGVLADHKKQISNITDAYSGLKSGLGQIVGLTATVFAANSLMSYGSELLNLQTRVVAYQGALSELSAITGVTGEGLKGLEDRAANLSTITLASGEIITNTSTDILNAFKLVGSAKPELLKSAEGMEAFTKEALIFAKASKTSVNEAVNSLSTTLEQFQAPASDASRYMNAMAAGAKEGSVEIDQTANAVQKFGAVVKPMNVSIEESIALVQVLGKTFKTGEEAGTALRNVLGKIQAPENLSKEALAGLDRYGVSLKKLQDPTSSLSDKLTELSKIQKDAGVMGKVFGDENIVAGRVILSNIPKFNDLTKAVTGTSEAYKQAAIMSDNLGSDVDNLKNTAGQFATELANKAAPTMRAFTQSLTEGVKWIKANWENLMTFGKAIIYATGVVISYIATVKAVALYQRAAAIATAAYEAVVLVMTNGLAAAAVAQRALNFVMSINPIGAVIALVSSLVAAYNLFSSSVSDSVRVQRLMNDVNTEAAKNTVEQRLKLEDLLKVAKDEKRSKEERLAAVKALNELSPEYLSNLTLEKINTQEATDAVNKYVSALEKKAKSEAALQKRTELEKQLIDLNSGKTDTKAGFLQSAGNSILAGNNGAIFGALQAKTSIENAGEARKGIQTEIDALNRVC
jgi:TP901 family phage tail tape measure protein